MSITCNSCGEFKPLERNGNCASCNAIARKSGRVKVSDNEPNDLNPMEEPTYNLGHVLGCSVAIALALSFVVGMIYLLACSWENLNPNLVEVKKSPCTGYSIVDASSYKNCLGDTVKESKNYKP